VIEHTFDAGAVALNYAAEGREAGRPMVFLHGVTHHWQNWLPVMTAFAAEWRVYALDLRGHGRSGRVAGAYRAVDYAADVVAFLRRRVGEPAVVVGHSLGAIVAIAVAADAPEAVRAVVLEDPPLGSFDDLAVADRPEQPLFTAWRDLAAAGLPPAQLFAALAEREPDVDVAALGAWALSLSQMDPGVLTAMLEDRARDGYGLAGRLRRIACPVLLQQGNVELGAAVDDARVARARALLARCTFEHFPDVGHMIHPEQPFAFCRSVRAFLGSLP
jgi:pimeloyl-ACP methyl ester carboxylesterase